MRTLVAQDYLRSKWARYWRPSVGAHITFAVCHSCLNDSPENTLSYGQHTENRSYRL